MVRILGVVLYLVGMGATGWAVRAAFVAPRRRAAALALVAPLALALAVLGLTLAIVPRFLR